MKRRTLALMLVPLALACTRGDTGDTHEEDTDVDSHVPTATDPSFAAGVTDPFGLVEVAKGITLGDLDDDGDLDVLTIDTMGVYYFENTGTETSPAFARGVHAPYELSASAIGIDLADLDGDQDLDVLVIDGNGLDYYENIGTPTSPEFTYHVAVHLGFSGEKGTSVDLVDVDGDEDLDAFTIDDAGVTYWENFQTVASPRFREGTHTYGLTAAGLGIVFADIDDDGDPDALTIDVWSTYFHENRGVGDIPPFSTSIMGAFGLQTGAEDLDLADIDGDGDLDAFTVNYEGTTFYENTNL